jgi:hypothetical protein
MNGFPSAWIDGRTEIRPRWGRRVGGRQTSAHDATGTWERVAPHQWAWHVACKSGPHVFGAPLPLVLLPGPGLAAVGMGAGVAAWGAPQAASPAQPDSPTLARIAETGTINLGHRESSVPFSYYDNKRQVVGYSQDLMLKVVDAIKAELKLPALTLRLVPVTSQNRIPLVQNGTVDLECGSTSHTTERATQVAFSTSFFVISTRLLVKRDGGPRDFPNWPAAAWWSPRAPRPNAAAQLQRVARQPHPAADGA